MKKKLTVACREDEKSVELKAYTVTDAEINAENGTFLPGILTRIIKQ